MKMLTVLIYLVGLMQEGHAQSKRYAYEYPRTKGQLKLNSLLKWSTDNYNAQSRLKEVKYHIVNGNLDMAKILLNESSLSIEFTKQIFYRYMAIIHFIEGNYELVLKTLSKPEMKNFSVQAKVCFLKILSQIILEKPKQAKKDWVLCKEATGPYSETDLTWMQTIVDLKTTDDKNYIKNYFNNLDIDQYGKNYLRIFLKLALYLNQQDKIIPRFKFFGSAPLEDEVERELIGLNYYRNGELIKANELLKDLTSANAEVFKGNLYLHQQKYEPAYAQFKLALQRKSNSQNALERLLPLSWQLQQWEEGLSFLKRIQITTQSNIAYDTLMAVFLSMAKKHDKAHYFLRKIDKKTNLSEPIEVSQLKVLNSLKRKKYLDILDPAMRSCSGNDGINCWFIIALTSWDTLIDHLGKSDLIHQNLKPLAVYFKDQNINNPIEEDKLLEQKAIEELDNSLIIL